MTFREELLACLHDELGISPKTVAKSMAQVIKGETVRQDFDGKGVLTRESRTVKPEDALKGAMIYDALRGGDLGLAPKSMITGKSQVAAVTHKRLTVDSRIIANADDVEEIVSLDEFLET